MACSMVRQIVTNISQKPTASTFTVEECATQEDESTDIKKLGCERANGRLLRKREIRI
jgi:hypothetical protein